MAASALSINSFRELVPVDEALPMLTVRSNGMFVRLVIAWRFSLIEKSPVCDFEQINAYSFT